MDWSLSETIISIWKMCVYVWVCVWGWACMCVCACVYLFVCDVNLALTVILILEQKHNAPFVWWLMSDTLSKSVPIRNSTLSAFAKSNFTKKIVYWPDQVNLWSFEPNDSMYWKYVFSRHPLRSCSQGIVHLYSIFLVKLNKFYYNSPPNLINPLIIKSLNY